MFAKCCLPGVKDSGSWGTITGVSDLTICSPGVLWTFGAKEKFDPNVAIDRLANFGILDGVLSDSIRLLDPGFSSTGDSTSDSSSVKESVELISFLTWRYDSRRLCSVSACVVASTSTPKSDSFDKIWSEGSLKVVSDTSG